MPAARSARWDPSSQRVCSTSYLRAWVYDGGLSVHASAAQHGSRVLKGRLKRSGNKPTQLAMPHDAACQVRGRATSS